MRRHYVVSGRVQGVGFRQFTADKAREFKLSGWVKNLPDGNVEAEAQGSAGEIAAFEKILYRGPALSRVDAVDVKDREDESDFSAVFEIRR